MAKKAATPATITPPLYGRVREILESARSNIARTVNTTQVIANWLIGREIVEEEQQGKKRAGYGTELLVDLAARLKADFGSGYGVDNLELFRRFYLEYPRLLPEQISDAVRRKSLRASADAANSDAARRNFDALPIAFQIQLPDPDAPMTPGQLSPCLSWTHYRRLLRVTRCEARDFYEIESIRHAWSARELERQINSLLFDRLAKSRDQAGLMRLATRGQEFARPIDMLKDPLVLEFLDLPESPRLVESKLEQALIGNLQNFLLELGKGFAFVSRQERITLDGDHFYIDLVFYHTVLKCFVLIDLKVGKLTHGDLGQIQFYVNYYDRERRTEGDNPTIGLILCPDKNDAVVKYTLGEQQERNIFTSRYQLYLPTVEELEDELRRELRFLAPGKDVAKAAPRARKAKSTGSTGE
ncbi:MAG: PDDEXK nuclease domain-containing protein [Azonexus sp.]|jgi:predicted nuclease of restriction endonuclease-like (RecB) superfamily|nr:PDDEXK nuclease domain-containing protein [Azonexus sp.]